jgi:N-acetylmuramoyl-L-alanine amidase
VPKFILDAGHGGWNFGVRAASGRAEKNYTLEIAQRLGRVLAMYDCEVVQLRNGDYPFSPERCFSADNAARLEVTHSHLPYDLYLSLHLNGTNTLSGSRVFHAIRADVRLRKLAWKMEFALAEALRLPHWHNAQAPIDWFQLQHNHGDALLLELCYADNPHDEEHLQLYMDDMVRAIVTILKEEYALQSTQLTVPDVPVMINGREISERGLLIDGRVFLPVRAIAEATGYDVTWHDAERRVDLRGNVRVQLETILKQL